MWTLVISHVNLIIRSIKFSLQDLWCYTLGLLVHVYCSIVFKILTYIRSVVCIWQWIINIIIGPYGCIPCPMGKYKADKGNGQCIGCPMGSTTMMMGSKKCNILTGMLFISIAIFHSRKYKFPSTAFFCMTFWNLNQNFKILKNFFSVYYKFLYALGQRIYREKKGGRVLSHSAHL